MSERYIVIQRASKIEVHGCPTMAIPDYYVRREFPGAKILWVGPSREEAEEKAREEFLKKHAGGRPSGQGNGSMGGA